MPYEAGPLVAAGVAFLDEQEARGTHMQLHDWKDRVDLAKLDIGNGLNCMLAQLFGAYWLGLSCLGLKNHSVTVVALGFVSGTATQPGYTRDDPELGEIADQEHTALTAEWIRRIEEYRAA